MTSSWNLLRSNAGIGLFHEICLLTAEQVLHEDPDAVLSLLLLSKVNATAILMYRN
jgi:hypothetical protein